MHVNCRLRKPVEASPVPLVADENGMVPLEESWKLLKSLGSFKAVWRGNLGSVLIVASFIFISFVLGYM